MGDSRNDQADKTESHLVIKSLNYKGSEVVAAIDRDGRIAFNLLGPHFDSIDILKCFRFAENRWNAIPSNSHVQFFLQIPRDHPTSIQDSSEFLIGAAHFVFRQDSSKTFPWGYLDLLRSNYPEGFRFPLIKPEGILIGRKPSEVDLPLIDDHWVSHQHARVFPADNQVWLEDLHTANGVFMRMTDEFPICGNERLHMFQSLFTLEVKPGGMKDHPGYFRIESKQIRSGQPRKVSESSTPIQPPSKSEHDTSRISTYLTNDPSTDHPDTSLDRLLSNVPKNAPYEEQAEAASQLTHEVRLQLASRIAPAFNAAIQAMPQDTYDQKKELAAWVNAELGRFGLAVKCPKTGLPAKLHGDTGNYPETGRFQFQVSTDSGRPHRTVNTPDLPVLELVDSTPDLDTQVSWQTQVGPKSSRPGRKLS
jgi:FHA domain